MELEAIPWRRVVESRDGRGLVALRNSGVSGGYGAALSNDLDVDGEVADDVAADVAECRRAQLRGRVGAFVTQDGRGGVERDRGDNATVDTLERCPLVVDVRPEATFTELRDGGGVCPVHVTGRGVMFWRRPGRWR